MPCADKWRLSAGNRENWCDLARRFGSRRPRGPIRPFPGLGDEKLQETILKFQISLRFLASCSSGPTVRAAVGTSRLAQRISCHSQTHSRNFVWPTRFLESPLYISFYLLCHLPHQACRADMLLPMRNPLPRELLQRAATQLRFSG